jgi:hypothetical protein
MFGVATLIFYHGLISFWNTAIGSVWSQIRKAVRPS